MGPAEEAHRLPDAAVNERVLNVPKAQNKMRMRNYGTDETKKSSSQSSKDLLSKKLFKTHTQGKHSDDACTTITAALLKRIDSRTKVSDPQKVPASRWCQVNPVKGSGSGFQMSRLQETQDASTTTKRLKEKTHDYKAQKVQLL